MWTYAPWQGRYLPHPLAPRGRLSAYATWCNAVEGNTTFYATPTRETVRSWAEQTDPDFRFILKLPALGWGTSVLYGLVVSTAAQLDDLMESMIKRDCERKDASETVPGFGGVLGNAIIQPLIGTPKK